MATANQPPLDPQIAAALRQHLVPLLAGFTRKITVAQVTGASGSIGDIGIDKIVLGSATIGHLTLQGTSLDIRSGTAYLQNVRIVLQLQLSVDWWYDLGFTSNNGTVNLGSLSFGVNVGNVLVPSLGDIPVSIPTLDIANLVANISPINNLDLGGADLQGLKVTNTTVAADGFRLTGIGLGAVSVANAQVPRTLVDATNVQRFTPKGNILVPSVQVGQIKFPSSNVANIQTTAGVAFQGIASRRGVGANLGIFGFTFWITPVAYINIGSMLLSNVSISGAVNSASVQNVSVPVDIQGINLKTIDILQLDVNSISL